MAPRLQRFAFSVALIARAAALSASKNAIAAHTNFVNSAGTGTGAARGDAAKHIERQRAVFDEAAAYFASPEASPPEVEAVLDALARRVVAGCAGAAPRVLDVGSGTGCLSRRYGAYGASAVVGVDLSPRMVAEAEAKGGAGVSYATGDAVDFCATYAGEPFDAVVFNACFGNFFDQAAALDAAAQVLTPGGTVVVAHPLGADFVDELQARDPSVVPHGLPRTEDAARALAPPLGPPLDVLGVDDAAPYYATWTRRPFARLAAPLGLRGPVARGYGRGGKDLGVPTANLPEDLFGDALRTVDAGVYGAWATLARDGPAAEPRPAVVNVGYSPTFVDAENPLKIAEAHLLDYEGGDFYGETMALVLVSRQRPERKFPDFPTLLANIRNDIDVARRALAGDAALRALRPKLAGFLGDGPVEAAVFDAAE